MDRRSFIFGSGSALALNANTLARAAPTVGEIVIGQSTAMSGPFSPPSLAVQSGVKLAFDEINAMGGIAQRRLRLVALDDALDAAKAAANYESLVNVENALACICGSGSSATLAGLPALREGGVPLVGAAVGDSVRDKTVGVAYYHRATQQREVEALAQHLATIGLKRVAIAFVGSPGGEEVLAKFSDAAQKQGLQMVGAAPIKLDGSNIAEAGSALSAVQAQAVVLYLTAQPAAGLIRAISLTGGSSSFYGLSLMSGDVVAKLLGDRLPSLAVTAITPYPWDGANPDAIAFRRLADRAGVPIGYHSYDGYIAARILAQAIRQSGRDISRSKLHASLARLKMRFANMDINFSAEGRGTGVRFVELVRVRSDGRYVR